MKLSAYPLIGVKSKDGRAFLLRPRLRAGLAEVAAVLLDEVLDPSREGAATFAGFEIEVTTGGTAEGTSAVDNEIPHGVDETRLLHVESKSLIHREFENFPNRSDSDGKAEAEDGDGEGRGGEAIALEEHEDAEEAKESEGHGRSAVQDDIPPPEALVEIAHFTKEEGGIDKEDDDDGEAAGELNLKAILVAKGDNGHDQGHGRSECGVPSQGVDRPGDRDGEGQPNEEDDFW